MHNVLIIFYIAFSIGNLFILPELKRLLGVFIAVVIFNLAGMDNLTCIFFGVVAGSVLVWGVFYLNKKYGPYGLMKRMALKQHPRRIIHRRNIRRLFNRKL